MKHTLIGQGLLALVAVAAGAAPTVASADVIVRLGGAWSEPDSRNFVFSDGSTLEVRNDGPVISGDVTWLFTEHLGVEFWLSDKFKGDLKLNQASTSTKVGSIDYMAPALSLQWHFLQDSWIRPYVGAGAAYAMYNGTKNFKIDDDFTWQAGGGIDIGHRYRGFFGNVFVKYFDMSPKTSLDRSVELPVPLKTGSGSHGSLDINPTVYGFNIGYRFGQAPSTPEPVAAAAPVVAAAAPEKCADSDNDGVCDSVDRCPNTPAGDRVGPNGCSCDVTIRTHFAFDSAELTAEDKAQLDKVAARLKELEFVEGVANGHTDSIGDPAYNMKLSERRAQAVVDYLASKGVAPGRMKAVGYGETKHIADNSTEEGRAQNRRVTIHRTDCGPAY